MKNKRIILLSDGTGNSAGKVWRTNVWRVFESLDLTSSQQIAFYDDGVGTSSFKPLYKSSCTCSTNSSVLRDRRSNSPSA